MQLEQYSAELLKEQLKAIFRKHLEGQHYKAFFFGSRVTGESKNISDIDVGIESNSEIDSEIWLNLQEDVFELPLIIKIDLVDFKRVTESFKKIATQKIELIYETRKAA